VSDKPQLLKYEELLSAHAGYTQVLAGLQVAQSGYEAILQSKIFGDMPEEVTKIRAAIQATFEQSKGIAKAKGALLEAVRNIDALGQKMLDQKG